MSADKGGGRSPRAEQNLRLPTTPTRHNDDENPDLNSPGGQGMMKTETTPKNQVEWDDLDTIEHVDDFDTLEHIDNSATIFQPFYKDDPAVKKEFEGEKIDLDDAGLVETEENKRFVQQVESGAMDEGVKTARKEVKSRVIYDNRLRITNLQTLVDILKQQNPIDEDEKEKERRDIQKYIQNINITTLPTVKEAKSIARKLKDYENYINWPVPDDTDEFQPYAFVKKSKQGDTIGIYINGRSKLFTSIETSQPSVDPYKAFELLESLPLSTTQVGDLVTLTWQGKTPVTVDVKVFGPYLIENGIKVKMPATSPDAEKPTKRRKTATKNTEEETATNTASTSIKKVEQETATNTASTNVQEPATATNTASTGMNPVVPSSSTGEMKPGEYEAMRLANIKRNEAELFRLGLGPDPLKIRPKQKSPVSTKKQNDDNDSDEDYSADQEDKEEDDNSEEEDDDNDKPKKSKKREPRQPKKVAMEKSSAPEISAPPIVIDENTRRLIDNFLNLGKQPTLSFYKLAAALRRPALVPSGAPMLSSAQLAAQSAGAQPTQQSRTTISSAPPTSSTSVPKTSSTKKSSKAKTVQPGFSLPLSGDSQAMINCLSSPLNIVATAKGLNIDLKHDDLTPKTARELCSEIVAKQNEIARKARTINPF